MRVHACERNELYYLYLFELEMFVYLCSVTFFLVIFFENVHNTRVPVNEHNANRGRTVTCKSNDLIIISRTREKKSQNKKRSPNIMFFVVSFWNFSSVPCCRSTSFCRCTRERNDYLNYYIIGCSACYIFAYIS